MPPILPRCSKGNDIYRAVCKRRRESLPYLRVVIDQKDDRSLLNMTGVFEVFQ
jgi:hypothetical protein